MTLRLGLILLIGFAGSVVRIGNAEERLARHVLRPEPGRSGFALGASVAFADDLIVASFLENRIESVVYRYRAETGDLVERIAADDAAAYLVHFGAALTTDGTSWMGGAPGFSGGPGPGGVFRSSCGWYEVPATTWDDGVGQSIAQPAGPVIWIGAPGHEQATPRLGAVHRVLDVCSDVIHLGTTHASDGTAGDGFGTMMATDGAHVLIAAPGAAPSGAVYVVDTEGTELGAYRPQEKATSRIRALAIDGAHAAVGEHHFSAPGRVTLLDLSDPARPVVASTIHAPDGHSEDHFGTSVAIDGDRLLIGAPEALSSAGASGAAYLYDISDPMAPRLLVRLAPTEPPAGAQYGRVVTLRASTLLVSAPEASFGADEGVGAIYVYDLATCSRADSDDSGTVGFSDLIAVVRAWGRCENCDADLNDDGIVSEADLLIVLAHWGSC